MYYSDYSSYASNSSYGTETAGIFAGAFLAIYIIMLIISLVACVLVIIALAKIFKENGKPAWAAIIPIYNFIVLCEIINKEWWYALLMLLPIANIYAIIVIYKGLTDKYQKSTGYLIGLILLPFVFLPLLAFKKEKLGENITQQQKVEMPIGNEQVSPMMQNTVTNEQASPVIQNTVTNEQASPMIQNTVTNEQASPVIQNTVTNEQASPVIQNTVTNEQASPMIQNTVTNEQASPMIQNTVTNEQVQPLMQDSETNIQINNDNNNEQM